MIPGTCILTFALPQKEGAKRNIIPSSIMSVTPNSSAFAFDFDITTVCIMHHASRLSFTDVKNRTYG
eukprot:scaffold5047_cov54-Cyclotella_meneghiniana.AAC.2